MKISHGQVNERCKLINTIYTHDPLLLINRPIKWGPGAPLQDNSHIKAAIKFDMIIQAKISQEFTVTVLLDNNIRHIGSAKMAQYILACPQISLNTCFAVGDFSLRRIGFNFRFNRRGWFWWISCKILEISQDWAVNLMIYCC